ncbi:MAG: hypothetical protein ACTSYJ_04445 [Candidatus Thorarchaeota archaeon]
MSKYTGVDFHLYSILDKFQIAGSLDPDFFQYSQCGLTDIYKHDPHLTLISE